MILLLLQFLLSPFELDDPSFKPSILVLFVIQFATAIADRWILWSSLSQIDLWRIAVPWQPLLLMIVVAAGSLLVQGTAHEVIASQSLVTWQVTGTDLPSLHARLRELPDVEQVAAFGSTLHVTGPSRERLQSALEPLMAEPGRSWQEIEPGLEDVFIHLMDQSKDNFSS